MEYIIKIDKYIKDRFKVFNNKEEVELVGEKIGDASSFFDAFVGETFSKGADFVFHSNGDKDTLKVERNFYDKNKEYKLFENGKIVGKIKSIIEESIIIEIVYKEENFKLKLTKNAKELKIENIGSITSEKQGFKSYETINLNCEDEKYFSMLVMLAVYIWDVFIKYKIAFV